MPNPVAYALVAGLLAAALPACTDRAADPPAPLAVTPPQGAALQVGENIPIPSKLAPLPVVEPQVHRGHPLRAHVGAHDERAPGCRPGDVDLRMRQRSPAPARTVNRDRGDAGISPDATAMR
jgi:hypothetical protein